MARSRFVHVGAGLQAEHPGWFRPWPRHRASSRLSGPVVVEFTLSRRVRGAGLRRMRPSAILNREPQGVSVGPASTILVPGPKGEGDGAPSPLRRCRSRFEAGCTSTAKPMPEPRLAENRREAHFSLSTGSRQRPPDRTEVRIRAEAVSRNAMPARESRESGTSTPQAFRWSGLRFLRSCCRIIASVTGPAGRGKSTTSAPEAIHLFPLGSLLGSTYL